MRNLFTIIACAGGLALNAVAFSPPIEGIEVLGQFVLKDNTHRTAQEILNASDFSATPYGRFIYTGSDRDQVWVKWEVEIRKPLPTQPVAYLEYPFPRYQSDLKSGQLYIATNNTVFTSTQQDENFESMLLPLPADLPPGRYDLLFSIQSSLENYPFAPVLTSKSAIHHNQNQILVITLPAIGFIGGIVLLGLFFFIQMRDRLFLWFSICYTFESSRIALLHYPLRLIPALEQLSYLSDQLLLTFGILSYYMFMRQLLRLQATAPRLNRILQAMCLILLILLPWQLQDPGFERCLLSFYIFFPFALILLSALIQIIRNQAITPRWMPLSWLCTTTAYLIISLASLFIKTGSIRYVYSTALLVMCIETFLFCIYSACKVRELKVQNSESRWEALHAQLNPHFVFNVMNDLGGLDSIRKIDRITADFAVFLRYILTSRLKKTVPLSEEIDALKHYIEMDAIRFDHEANVKFVIPDTLESVPIIPLLIQPLMENALKHTRAQKLVPDITIEAMRHKKSGILLRITNNGAWGESSTAKGTSTGIRNLEERLRLAYQDKAQFSFEHTDDTVAATIVIDALL